MNSSGERDNPPPRRKSCEACRAAKRRCDLALPACFRCTRRGLTCAYPGLPAPDMIPEMLLPEIACGAPPSFTPTPVFDMDFMDLSLPAALETRVQIEVASLDLQQQPQDEQRSFEVTLLGIGHVPFAALVASRFQYAIDTLKDTPRMMVVENQTPWCHREQHSDGMPKAMQDAYACCAIYITKNPVNTPVITRQVQARHEELLLSPLPTSPPDLLAHTQALLLYQIMHLFEPGLGSTAAIDSLSISALESAATFLFRCTHFPPGSDNSDSGPDTASMLPATIDSTMQFWKLWVFEESARRTILFVFYFILLFRLLRGERNLSCAWKLGVLHSWYLSAHLWNAPTAFDFAVAWVERDHLIVRNVNFSQVLQEAQPSDMDTFGKMLLVTALGVEATQTWFSRRGAIL